MIIQSQHERENGLDYPIVWMNLNQFYMDIDLSSPGTRYRRTTYKAFSSRIYKGSVEACEVIAEYFKRKG